MAKTTGKTTPKTTPKTTKPAFMPSPRPRPRTSPEDAHQLASATGDLGFTRASNAPEAAKPEQPAHPRYADSQGAKNPVAHSEAPDSGTAPDPKAPPRVSSLKFEVPDAVWVALRQEALNRRVTVRYLVLEALAAKGYAVDLSTVPEDGRRLR
jgi:hypothetical protein